MPHSISSQFLLTKLVCVMGVSEHGPRMEDGVRDIKLVMNIFHPHQHCGRVTSAGGDSFSSPQQESDQQAETPNITDPSAIPLPH